MIQGRVGDEELELTPELLASMLGSRRAGVTVAAGTLRKADLIEYTRGQIVICDREGLDDVACECCDILREQLESALCRR
jgi:hypothetical protein